jgi:cobalt-zinc-cadmium resistance protein CzcA
MTTTARNVALGQLQAAIANANQNVGGQRLALGEQSFDVRGIGLIRSVQDIGDITITAAKGVPVRVRDVAAVSVGSAPRLGIVGQDDESDVVEGIVLMRYGGDSLKTIQGIHERVEYIRSNRVLPPGVDLEPVYDRADLVKLTTHTVMENLLVGMILVSLVLWLFLGSARAALITAVNLPLALLFAFTGMVAGGTAANLISLGAVDFGIVVDHRAAGEGERAPPPGHPPRWRLPHGEGEHRWPAVRRSAHDAEPAGYAQESGDG